MIDKVNNSKVLNTKINFDEILKHRHDFFMEGVKNNKIQLEGIIIEFVYKNEIQEFLDAKNDIIKKVNLKKQDINKLKNKFLNEDYKSKYLEIQEYNYSIRELSNSYLSNFKENEIENEKNKLKEKFQNKNHIEIIKIKNEIKKINLEIQKILEKKQEILQKMETYSANTKRNEIIKKRFQKIIDKYQGEIDLLNIEINKKEKTIFDKSNLGDVVYSLNEPEIINEDLSLRNLIDKVKSEKEKNMLF